MKILIAKKDDIKELYLIESKVFENDENILSLNSFYYHLKKNLIYKIVIEKKIVGYILWLERDSFFRLYSLAILKEYQNLGLASKLLQFSLKNLNKKNLQLEVRVSNVKAIKLYEKFGFKKVKILKEYYKNEDGILMRLER